MSRGGFIACLTPATEMMMNIDKFVFAFAGSLILISLLLAWMVHPYWYGLTAFVGLNMFQAAFMGFCPLALILKRLGVKPGSAFA